MERAVACGTAACSAKSHSRQQCRAAWCVPPRAALAAQRQRRRAAGRAVRRSSAQPLLASASSNGVPSAAAQGTIEPAADGQQQQQADELVWTKFVAETLLPTRHGKFRLRGYRHTVRLPPAALVCAAVQRGWRHASAPLAVTAAAFAASRRHPPLHARPSGAAASTHAARLSTPWTAGGRRADLHRALGDHFGEAGGHGGCARAGARRLLHQRGAPRCVCFVFFVWMGGAEDLGCASCCAPGAAQPRCRRAKIGRAHV